MAGPIGIIANPASGKDVRRLVARASVFDNQEKQAIVRRLLLGALATGAEEVRFLDDAHGIVRGALEDLPRRLNAQPVDATQTGTALDTISAARAMEDVGCAVVVSLGGDGTNRAVALGWRSVPLLPLSTGTNNVFPVIAEATVAGMATGLIASGRIRLRRVAEACKVIELKVEDEREDLALIDAVLSAEQFVGARALLDANALRQLLLTRADPSAVGMTSVGGLLKPMPDSVDAGLQLTLNAHSPRARTLHAPIAPGLLTDVAVDSCRQIPLGKAVQWRGPGVLAFDGERERVIAEDQQVELTVERNGPRVIDVNAALTYAAEKRLLAG
ncbi:MAG: NAD(+)/NADH kinase [Pseudomonadota bacterium]